MKAVVLESERLFYVPLSLQHLSIEYVNWLKDDKTNMYLETRGDYTLEKLDYFLKEQEKKEILFWAIHLKDSKKHIGNIKIDPIDSKNNSGEYGILIGEKAEWGKGYAKEASNTVIEYCFNNLKLSQITLGVVSKNHSAFHLYKGLGFSIESIIIDYGVYQNEMCNSLRMVKKNDR
jgi:ribosomal-protein-alanine N-acetyltransferase